MFVDNAQQCFAFTPQANFPAHNLNFLSLKVKVMVSNPGYLLKPFLLYPKKIGSGTAFVMKHRNDFNYVFFI